MAWLSMESGQSAADLLALPASVYYALRGEVITRIAAVRQARHNEAMQDEVHELLGDLKRQMGRA